MEAVLHFSFRTKKLERLYAEGQNREHYPDRVVEAFFDVMLLIESAADESEFHRFPSLHFEKLGGPRKGQHSIALADGFRLVFTIEKDKEGKYIYILQIVNYHGRVRGGKL